MSFPVSAGHITGRTLEQQSQWSEHALPLKQMQQIALFQFELSPGTTEQKPGEAGLDLEN